MNIYASICSLSKFERLLWAGSVTAVTGGFLLAGNQDWLTLVASLIGVTALIFVAKGAVIGQVLTILFSVVYGIISYQFQYYGEMITYLGMTAPIALLSVITWMKHPYDQCQVQVNRIGKKAGVILALLTVVVTGAFYFILEAFGNANLEISTLSVATSFLASSFMLLRSSLYAVAYAANDVVLILLWVLASIADRAYLPMVICFSIFLINDLYGFRNWRKMHLQQTHC